MNPGCREFEVLVSLRAAGAGPELSAPDAARLDAHLTLCAPCRQALEQGRELLDLVRLSEPDATENLILGDLPSRTLAELRRRDRRRGLARRVLAAGAGIAIAAGLAIALLSPAWRPSVHEAPGSKPVVVAQAGWQEPDVDALWNASAVVDYGSGSSSDTTMTDAALAAYDAGAGDSY